MKSVTRVVWLAEYRTEKDDLFRAVVEVGGAGKRLAFLPMRLRGFPETAERAAACLARAKKMPKSKFGQWLKLKMIAGQYNWSRAYFGKNPADLALCWNGLTGSRRAFMQGALDAGAPRLFAELAPLPGRVTLDPTGVNFEGSAAADPPKWADIAVDETLLSGLKSGLTARAPRRADVGQVEKLDHKVGKFLFVPLQVPDDSQIRLFSGWIGGMEGFIAALAKASAKLPEGWHIRLKEHPSAKVSLAGTLQNAVEQGARFVVDNETDSFVQMQASQGLITVNSSMGLQAFLHDVPVLVTGQAFWTLDGLATVADGQTALETYLRNPEALSFDGSARARFLTYLATDYYIRKDDQQYDIEHISRKINRN